MYKNKNVYIIGDVSILLTQEEYINTFTEEQIESLEKGEIIKWIDEEGQNHSVRLIAV